MLKGSVRDTLRELTAVVSNDELRGGVGEELLAVRFHAALDARKAREPYAYRQALLELAACATALTTRLKAPSAPVPRIAYDSAQSRPPPRAARISDERLALARSARELRAAGHHWAEIGATLGVSRSYAQALVGDPDGTRAAARRQRAAQRQQLAA
jgi:hypothetical protein